MRRSSMSWTSLACFASVAFNTSRVMRLWRTSTMGVAPAARTARINSTVNSSGTSIMSRRTFSPFFMSVE